MPIKNTVAPQNLGLDFRVLGGNKYLNDSIVAGIIAPAAPPVEPQKVWLWHNRISNQLTHAWNVATQTWTPLVSPAAPANDFFRKTNGATLPDGTADYTSPITHNANVGILQTANPISPLTFGEVLQADAIRLRSNGFTNPFQFYGIGVLSVNITGGNNRGSMIYSCEGPNTAHTFYGSVSATARKPFAQFVNRGFIVGDPQAPVGEGHLQMSTFGDDASFQFRSPSTALGGIVSQAELFFNGWSGNSNLSGASVTVRTRNTNASNAPLVDRLIVGAGGEVAISNPFSVANVSVLEGAIVGAAALSVAGAIRLKGGPIAIGATRQVGGLVFGMTDTGLLGAVGTATEGDNDSGLTSIGDGNLTFYTNSAIAGTVNGSVWAKPGGGQWAGASDRRTKKNVKPYGKGLTDLAKINIVSYQYNGAGDTVDDGRIRVGVIAQELQLVEPTWVSNSTSVIAGSPVLQADTSELLYLAVESIKELSRSVATLKADLDATKKALTTNASHGSTLAFEQTIKLMNNSIQALQAEILLLKAGR